MMKAVFIADIDSRSPVCDAGWRRAAPYEARTEGEANGEFGSIVESCNQWVVSKVTILWRLGRIQGILRGH
jgi:hypothetical protein